jgi:hypothetical protein
MKGERRNGADDVTGEVHESEGRAEHEPQEDVLGGEPRRIRRKLGQLNGKAHAEGDGERAHGADADAKKHDDRVDEDGVERVAREFGGQAGKARASPEPAGDDKRQREERAAARTKEGEKSHRRNLWRVPGFGTA